MIEGAGSPTNPQMGHRYDYEINLADGSAPARVVRMVGTGKRVLDIGAGPGSIARVLTEKCNCRVTAVEIDDDVMPLLAPVCEQVHRLDLNDESWPQRLGDADRFDVVIAADVLEHLYDPWATLARMTGLIKEDGYVVVSLPHASYAGMLASLLDNNFEYRVSGLLDRTHLRFFGIRNMQALFDNAGLAIEDVEFFFQHPENTEFAEVWLRTPSAVRIELLRNQFSRVYQVVVKTVPMSAAGQRISLMERNESESDEVASAAVRQVAVAPIEGAQADGSGERIRLIAFFLPQFHPIPENDLWWGKGFTEWTNVTQAEPLFGAHYQPHLPADLGFYDLRLKEARHEQIAMARQYGIDGFCYYYYWFSRTRVLNRPLDDMLSDPESPMPFCLCWANENWTRRWDGGGHEVLLEQQHLAEDDLDFIKSVVPFLQDPRYIRIEGAPFLIVYRAQDLRNPIRSIEVWREHCEAIGIGRIHLSAALTFDNEDYSQFGFDSGIQFPPHNRRCASVNSQIDFYTPFHGSAVEYSAFAESYLNRTYPDRNVFRTACPSWDHTPRVGSRSFLTLNATPANYEYWLSESISQTRRDYPGEERFVFVNAWNEWAEGCHLEPDQRFGRQFLEATFRAKTGESRKTAFEDVGPPRVFQPLAGAKARLAEVEEELTLARERFSSLENELDEVRRSYEAQIQRASDELGEVHRSYEAQIQRASDELDEVHRSYEAQIQRASDELDEVHRSYEAQIQRASDELDEVHRSYEAQIQRASDELDEVHRSYEAQIQRASDELDEVEEELTLARERFSSLKNELGEVRRGYESQIQSLESALMLEQRTNLSLRGSLGEVGERLSHTEQSLSEAQATVIQQHDRIAAQDERIAEQVETMTRQSNILNWIYGSRLWLLARMIRVVEDLRQRCRKALSPFLQSPFVGLLESVRVNAVPGDGIDVRGWVHSNASSVLLVEAFLDDWYLGPLRYGIARPDIVEADPSVPLESGYSELIRMSGLQLSGKKRLKIRVYDEAGNKQIYESSITRGQLPESPRQKPDSMDGEPGTPVAFATAEFSDSSARMELPREISNVIADFQDRMQREPSILDWTATLHLAEKLHHLAVCSPLIDNAKVLPYLDRSIDIVVMPTAAPDRISEARRVADAAVVQIDLADNAGETADSAVETDWVVDAAPIPSLPTASIIIPAYNQALYTERCLEQLGKTLPKNFSGEVVIVDDASSDETPAILDRWSDQDFQIQVLRNPKNSGFVASCNRGAAAANGDVLVFLNNDTLPQPGWLHPLLKTLRDESAAGAVSGKLLYPDGRLQEAGGVVFSDGTACNFGRNESAGTSLFNFLREVDYGSGALLATWRDLFTDLGGFDTRFEPAYYEDTDYCFAVRSKGYRVYYQPASVVIHVEGASAGTDVNTGMKRYQEVNRIKFVEKWRVALQRQPAPPVRYDFATLHALAAPRHRGERGD